MTDKLPSFMEKHIFFNTLLITVFLFACPALYSQSWSKYDYADELEFTEYVVMPEILLYKLMREEKDFVLYDIRSEKEFSASHIAGSKNLPWKSGKFLEHSDQFPTDKALYIVSGDGIDGFDAVRLLLEKGFAHVYTIEGGLANWPYTRHIVR
jgi:rhodanese-related sulfurtransferase